MNRIKTFFGKAVLLAPFFLLFLWFGSLVITRKNVTSGVELSPGRLNTLVTFLFIFIIIYGAFLFFELRKIRKSKKKK
ncbi:hypothetical protein J4209_06260 [Candidatus Woesearchaeota archaeon]|nr:hypothetical protein [Candidatus Woesearchaeota archaeon]